MNDRIVVENKQSNLSQEEISNASTVSKALFDSCPEFWPTMEKLFGLKSGEKIARLEIDDEGIWAYFVTKTLPPKVCIHCGNDYREKKVKKNIYVNRGWEMMEFCCNLAGGDYQMGCEG